MVEHTIFLIFKSLYHLVVYQKDSKCNNYF